MRKTMSVVALVLAAMTVTAGAAQAEFEICVSAGVSLLGDEVNLCGNVLNTER